MLLDITKTATVAAALWLVAQAATAQDLVSVELITDVDSTGGACFEAQVQGTGLTSVFLTPPGGSRMPFDPPEGNGGWLLEPPCFATLDDLHGTFPRSGSPPYLLEVDQSVSELLSYSSAALPSCFINITSPADLSTTGADITVSWTTSCSAVCLAIDLDDETADVPIVNLPCAGSVSGSMAVTDLLPDHFHELVFELINTEETAMGSGDVFIYRDTASHTTGISFTVPEPSPSALGASAVIALAALSFARRLRSPLRR